MFGNPRYEETDPSGVWMSVQKYVVLLEGAAWYTVQYQEES